MTPLGKHIASTLGLLRRCSCAQDSMGAIQESRSIVENPKTPTSRVTAIPQSSRHGGSIKSGRGGWKPYSHRTPSLLLFIGASIGLAVFLQVLLLKSQQNDGIFFARNIDGDLPLASKFLYNYLPTIVAVVLSIWWTWIDADAKRLEPFYQLSRPKGCLAEDSLQLHYASDFVAVVPIKAFRKGHWPVFSASLAMVIIFWVITPMQAGIFATEQVHKVESLSMNVSTGHTTLADQQKLPSAALSASIYGIMWLNSSLPSFMTHEYALWPFKPARDSFKPLSQDVISATTRRFSVDLDCQQARLFTNATEGVRNFYTNDAGCTVPQYGPTRDDTVSAPSADPFTGSGAGGHAFTSFVAGYMGLEGDFYLSRYCPESFSDTFLVSFGKAGTGKDPTAMFCRPQYHSQAVNANISMPRFAVLDTTPIGLRVPIGQDFFNASRLYAIMLGTEDTTKIRSEIPPGGFDSSFLTPQIAKLDLNLQVSGLIRLPSLVFNAIGAYPRPLEDYLDPVELKNSYEAAWRLMFSHYVLRIIQTSSVTAVQGLHSYDTEAVAIVPVFVIVVEVALVVVALLAGWFLVLTATRSRHLSSDPASISSVMSLVADDEKLLQLFSPLDQHSATEVNDLISQRRFAMSTAEHDEGLRLLANQTDGVESANRSLSSDTEAASPIRPTELHELTLLALFVLFAAAMAGGIALWLEGSKHNGLGLPSQARFVRQLVESYIPTVIATFFEPCWVVVNRVFCLLQPWEELRKNRPRAQNSLSLNYFDVPPQLTFVKAFGARHMLLSLVCFMALLANVLSVAFSGLLNEKTVVVAIPRNTTFPFQLPFIPSDTPVSLGPTNISTIYDFSDDVYRFPEASFYNVYSNLTVGSALPQWSDKQFFYFPQDVEQSGSVNESRQFSTRTFGARYECQELNAPDNLGNVLYDGFLSRVLDVNYNDGATARCKFDDAFSRGRAAINGCAGGNISAQGIFRVQPVSSIDQDVFSVCRSISVFAWWRGKGPADECRSDADPRINDSLVMVCRPFISTGTAVVTTDYDNKILASEIQGDLDDNVETFFPAKSVALQILGPWSVNTGPKLADVVGDLVPLASTSKPTNASPWNLGYGHETPVWNNDSFPNDVANWILQTMNPTSTLLDPHRPLPDSQEVERQLSSMHAFLFATTLGTARSMVLYNNTNVVSTSDSTAGGKLLSLQTRIFVSKPMWLIGTVILALYIIAIILIMVRRPARYLPRMPSTLTSIIAYMAASHALSDMKHTAHFTNAERDAYVKQLGRRYGYGAYIGADGKRHVGIEMFDDGTGDTVGMGLAGQLHKDLPRGLRSWWIRMRTRRARMDSFRRAVQQTGQAAQQEDPSFWQRLRRRLSPLWGKPNEISISGPLNLA